MEKAQHKKGLFEEKKRAFGGAFYVFYHGF